MPHFHSLSPALLHQPLPIAPRIPLARSHPALASLAMEFVSRKGVSPREDSTESVVLHEDDGEEVAMPVSSFLPASKHQHPDESESDCVDDWLSNDAAYWNSGARVRSRRWKVLVDDVDKTVTAVKRKYDECAEVSASEIGEETDEEEASSSDSDASEYESAYNKRRRTQRSEEEEEVGHVDELKEMQLLLESQLKASERREAGMKQRMETMMELMSRHVGHVEKCVSTMEDGPQPQEQILERINVKLEQLMEGFSTLNENLSILSACLSRDLDSQR